MPLYKWKCEHCGRVAEEHRPMKECKNPCTCACGEILRSEDRDYTIGKHVTCGDKERVSTALGVHPSQIGSVEVEKIHPGARFNKRGDMLLKNLSEQRKRLKERNWVDRNSYC